MTIAVDYDILNLTSPITRRQRHDMTIAVDWDAKHQFKQNKRMVRWPEEIDELLEAYMAHYW